MNEDVIRTVREHREELEMLAKSDLPCSKYARELLEVIDSTEEG
ncbi:MAG: hypothetical protein ABEI06_05300 [Halobacteriaceae archaeon]